MQETQRSDATKAVVFPLMRQRHTQKKDGTTEGEELGSDDLL